jgi:hypothetical protein
MFQWYLFSCEAHNIFGLNDRELVNLQFYIYNLVSLIFSIVSYSVYVHLKKIENFYIKSILE